MPDGQTGIGAAGASVQAARARYLTPTNSFREKLPPVPAMMFTAERDRALDPAAPTGAVACDIAHRLASPVPASTPLLLARYLRVRAGETLRLATAATAEIYYVIHGSGETRNRDDCIAWGTGDILCLPGGAESLHAAESDSVLWAVTNEPEAAFHRLAPVAAGPASLEALHFPAAEIAGRLDALRKAPDSPDASGKVIVFAAEPFEKMLSLTPSMTLALNTMEPGRAQRAHRHNSVAVTLNIACKGCYSMIDGKRIDWQPFAAMVTPPADVHSHHNDGDKTMTCLIVQDGGLHYHCRTMDFRYAD